MSSSETVANWVEGLRFTDRILHRHRCHSEQGDRRWGLPQEGYRRPSHMESCTLPRRWYNLTQCLIKISGSIQLHPAAMYKNSCLPRFVGRSPTIVVGCGSSTGDGRIEDNDAAVLSVTGIRRWEGGISQESSAGTRNEADDVGIQNVGSTQPQLGFHRGLVRATKANVGICLEAPRESMGRVCLPCRDRTGRIRWG